MKTTSRYVLGNNGESHRLNYQSEQRNYNPNEEITASELELKDGMKALDAGCGTGIMSRCIIDANKNKDISVIGIDSSTQRINEAKEQCHELGYSNIDLEVSDLKHIELPDNSIDLIVCRFVYEHVSKDCQEITKEFYRVLKPQGRLIIVDSDGILYNLDTEDKKLNQYLNTIQNSDFNFDGFICKKIPRFLLRSGFEQKNIMIKPKPMLFYENIDRAYEKELWEMRFSQISPILESILGVKEYAEFTELYIKEFMNPENFLYYSKFSFTALKA